MCHKIGISLWHIRSPPLLNEGCMQPYANPLCDHLYLTMGVQATTMMDNPSQHFILAGGAHLGLGAKQCKVADAEDCGKLR